MKKFLLIFIPIILAVIVFLAVQYYISQNGKKGALQVTATPNSTVFLNGNMIGKTPLCKCDENNMIPVGKYTLKIVPMQSELPSYQEKIVINKSVMTVVDRLFGRGATSEGSVITLTPIDSKTEMSILVLSTPDDASVFIDNNSIVKTPYLLKNPTESDHEIKITKNGYKDKKVKIHTVNGYKVTLSITLSVDIRDILLTPTPIASSSAKIITVLQKISILQTSTGFLRVRKIASVSGDEIGRLSSGEVLEIIEEKSGWIKIEMDDGEIGWINAGYTKKISQ
ncbi:hypothetical protein LBMAG33_6210 [Candidatus Levyibacteriota bacterium]|nr:hypothetical protein LBMAG33_6210 [Candidatus Levybacteria bacterium]